MTDNNGRALREAKAWAVVNRSGDIIVSTVSRTRQQAIQDLTGDGPQWRRAWKFWRRQGVRCVRVRVLSVGEEG